MGEPRSLPSTVVFILCLLRRPIPTRPAQRVAFHFRRQFLSSDKGEGGEGLKNGVGSAVGKSGAERAFLNITQFLDGGNWRGGAEISLADMPVQSCT